MKDRIIEIILDILDFILSDEGKYTIAIILSAMAIAISIIAISQKIS